MQTMIPTTSDGDLLTTQEDGPRGSGATKKLCEKVVTEFGSVSNSYCQKTACQFAFTAAHEVGGPPNRYATSTFSP